MERVLGVGGMGVVVLATHLRMAQLVAIKVLRRSTRDQPEIVQRFAREARAAARLRGEHTVRILDVDDSEAGDPFLVMEYLVGTDLQAVLAKEGALPIGTATEYLLQACEGMAEAHAAGLVHRDLKPANLFLTTRPDGSALVKVLDFGISKILEDGLSPEPNANFLVTRPATTMGSPAYMSPEHVKNAGDVDARSDIWSLGIVLHQLLTNALPFEATSIAALAARIAADPPRSLREVLPESPPELEAVVARCLAKSPSDRFPDVAALALALAPFTSHGSVHAARIARVLANVEHAGPASATASPPAPVISSSPTASLTGSIVASGSGPNASPLEKAMSTEYASTVGEAKAAAEPRGRMRWAVGSLAVLVLGGVALAWQTRAPVPVAPVAAASVAPTAPARVSSVPFTESAPDVMADAAPPVVATASAAPVKRPGAPRSPRPHAADAGKNPMDIDFR